MNAHGLVVEADPADAVRDAIAMLDPAPTEIIVSTHPEEQSGWLRRKVIDRVREASGGLPVEHIVVDLKAAGGEMPETLCSGRLAVDQLQRLIRIDGHPIGITEMEYRVLELLAFARNNVVTRAMLLKHLYRRADDQPQPKIIDVFISKLRKKLRMASNGHEFIETIPQRGWILRDLEASTDS